MKKDWKHIFAFEKGGDDIGFGVISEIATGFPDYDSVIGRDSATIGRILLENGYRTSWFGKDHNTPVYQTNQAGPFYQCLHLRQALSSGALSLQGRQDR